MELLSPETSLSWLVGLLFILPLFLMVWAVVDIVSGNMPEDKKAVWAIAVVAVPVAGSILYFILKNNSSHQQKD